MHIKYRIYNTINQSNNTLKYTLKYNRAEERKKKKQLVEIKSTFTLMHYIMHLV